MPQIVWSARPDGVADYRNARWYDFTGLPPGSTDDEWDRLLHPDDRERVLAHWRACLVSGTPFDSEYRLRHRSGQYRWTLGRALPMRAEDGVILRWIGTGTDVHDARQIAEERELISQELSHRIKNAFLVIAGLISLSARQASSADTSIRSFAKELRERVIALGRAHNFLRPTGNSVHPDAEAVTLHGLLAELVEPYRIDGDPRFRLEGDDLAIDDRAATPIALLMHELATNAVKYGALSVAGGGVAIESRLRGDRVAIAWTETGGPQLAGHSPSEGFGARVLRLSVESQLGGTLQYLWRAEGLQVVADIPCSSLVRLGGRQNLYGPAEGPTKTA